MVTHSPLSRPWIRTFFPAGPAVVGCCSSKCRAYRKRTRGECEHPFRATSVVSLGFTCLGCSFTCGLWYTLHVIILLLWMMALMAGNRKELEGPLGEHHLRTNSCSSSWRLATSTLSSAGCGSFNIGISHVLYVIIICFFLRRQFMYSRLASDLLDDWRWPWTFDSPASTSRVPGWHACTTRSGFCCVGNRT